MPEQRTFPYLQFNFVVDFGGGDAEAGFEECSGLSSEVAVVEYRSGSDPSPNPRKLTGLTRVGDVTLRRGLGHSTALWQWLAAAETNPAGAARDVTVTLQDEQRKPVVRWRLIRARPVRWTVPPLSARRSEVAVEELVLACESLAFEAV